MLNESLQRWSKQAQLAVNPNRQPQCSDDRTAGDSIFSGCESLPTATLLWRQDSPVTAHLVAVNPNRQLDSSDNSRVTSRWPHGASVQLIGAYGALRCDSVTLWTATGTAEWNLELVHRYSTHPLVLFSVNHGVNTQFVRGKRKASRVYTSVQVWDYTIGWESNW